MKHFTVFLKEHKYYFENLVKHYFNHCCVVCELLLKPGIDKNMGNNLYKLRL